jgi:hypothetical protein
MERRSAKPRWGWLASAILLFWGVLVLRASTQDFWARDCRPTRFRVIISGGTKRTPSGLFLGEHTTAAALACVSAARPCFQGQNENRGRACVSYATSVLPNKGVRFAKRGPRVALGPCGPRPSLTMGNYWRRLPRFFEMMRRFTIQFILRMCRTPMRWSRNES